MKHTDWNKLYNTYVKNYNKAKNKLGVLNEEMYTKKEFEQMYLIMERTQLKRQERGEIKKSLNITQNLLNRQKYEHSRKWASNTRESYYRWYESEYGQKAKPISINKVRMGEKGPLGANSDFWRQVSEAYYLHGAHYVGVTFFGSPE